MAAWLKHWRITIAYVVLAVALTVVVVRQNNLIDTNSELIHANKRLAMQVENNASQRQLAICGLIDNNRHVIADMVNLLAFPFPDFPPHDDNGEHQAWIDTVNDQRQRIQVSLQEDLKLFEECP